MDELKLMLAIVGLPPLVISLVNTFQLVRFQHVEKINAQRIEADRLSRETALETQRETLAAELDAQRLRHDFERDKLRRDVEIMNAQNAAASVETDRIREDNTAMLIKGQQQSTAYHIDAIRAIEQSNANERERLAIEKAQAEILQTLVSAHNALDKHMKDNVVTITEHLDLSNSKVQNTFESIRRDLDASAEAMHDVGNIVASLDQKTANLPDALFALTEAIKELPEQMSNELKDRLDKIQSELEHVTEQVRELKANVNAAVPDTPKPNGDVQHVTERDGIDPAQRAPGSEEVTT